MSRSSDERLHESGLDQAAQAQAEAQAPSQSPLEQIASGAGNAAMGGALARSEAPGILDGGRVHPEVENTISSRRGGGSSLDSGVAHNMSSKLGDDFSDVRVHTDHTADALARSVQARAFATGNDVYFAKGEYKPGTPDGDKLIGHELTHVTQQRGAPTGGPLTVTTPGDAQESEADKVAEHL